MWTSNIEDADRLRLGEPKLSMRDVEDSMQGMPNWVPDEPGHGPGTRE
jgi:hypothetical protein